MKNNRTGKVWLVGAGPGDPGLLTLRAVAALESADVLLYDALASDATVAMAPAGCERIFVGKRGGKHAMPQPAIEALLVEKAREGKRVVRLKGGDPFVFGRGGEEAQRLHANGIPFEIVPGITSAIAAPAYAGIPVTHRESNTAFTVATGHEDPTKAAPTLDWSSLADSHGTLVLLMAMGNLDAIAKRLIAHGRAAQTPVAVIQDGTRPTQRTLRATLETVASQVEAAGIGAPAIVVVGEVVRLRDELRWFDRAALFGKRVLLTRPANAVDAFARAVYARGAEPICAPTIAIVPPSDPHPAHRAIDQLADYAWVAFASGNGVDAFFDRLASLDCDARYLGKTKVAAIGSKTAERLARYGIRADLVPAAYVGEELARALIERTCERDRILIFAAEGARDALPQMLREAGRTPTAIAAYRSVVASDPDFATKVSSADPITFTSASTVAGFASLLGSAAAAVEAARGKAIVCIGPITAEAAAATGLSVDAIADEFTTDGVLDALEAHFSLRA